eukprot:156990_1
MSTQQVKKLSIDGVLAAAFSPFDSDGKLNLKLVPQQAEYFVNSGVKGVYLTGTTGESFSLSVVERKQVFKAWADIKEEKNYKLYLFAQVGCNCLEDSVDLAKYAASIGCDAISSTPPFYFRPATLEQLIKFLKVIADSVPNKPFYYYHIPGMTGVKYSGFSMYDLLLKVEDRIPNFVGIKYTGMYEPLSFADVMKIRRYSDKFEVLTGRDELILQSLSAGVKGIVALQTNYIAVLFNEVIDLYKQGKMEEARKVQLQIIDLKEIQSFTCSPGKNVPKYLMNLTGIKVGDSRLPFEPLT